MIDFMRNMLAMIELELRRLRHDRTELYTRAVQPILWIAIYGPIMSGVKAIPTGGIPYTDYITPGVLIQSTTFVSIFFGLIMVWERESGILKKLFVTPASKYSTVIGRSMSSGVRAIFQVLIIVPVALLIGVRFIPDIAYFISALLIIFFASGGFASISILVASFMKTRERFMGIGQAIIFPLFFASNALYPVKMMPPILQYFALFNPMSYVVDAVRGLMISGDLTDLPIDLLAIALFDAIMFVAASVSFKRIIE
ncbi:MAG: ABC transporter permease [Candidatus Bathyarchaeota archaeon]|nr:ABC transporter permease [Candidatus Bathyarchaeota archaeon]